MFGSSAASMEKRDVPRRPVGLTQVLLSPDAGDRRFDCVG